MALTRDSAAGVAGQGEPQMVGRSPLMQRLREQLALVASRGCTVLLTGETGVGKELAARQIHIQSPRASRPFIPVDCTAFSATLFESQLFGHVKGAFTGAEQSTLGFFRAADRGTLFLDEVGELPSSIQGKLLRCIQQRSVVPLGATEPIRVNVRIVGATHRDLERMVSEGNFREDLFFRLNVVCLQLPPLRQRREDIPQLAGQFLDELAEINGEQTYRLSVDALAVIQSYDWPGNVRQLQNALEHASVFCGGCVIRAQDLPASVRSGPGHGRDASEADLLTLKEAERMVIARALRATQGNQSRAARLLGIERHLLRRKILRHGLQSLAKRKPG